MSRGTSYDDPSGALRAQEAHDAGAVEPVVELPNHVVRLEFRVHGTKERADLIARDLVDVLLDEHDVVHPVAASVGEQ